MIKRQRTLLQDKKVVSDVTCPEECKAEKMGCKHRKTALLLSITLGIYGCDRFYLGYNLQGLLKITTVIFGCCLPLCHFYIFGFDPANNVDQNKKKKKVRAAQKFCRCTKKKSRVPCFKVGNPTYCILFVWFLMWYIYDIYYIANGTLVDQFNQNKACYLMD